MKIAVLTITKEAERLGKTLAKDLANAELICCRGNTAKAIALAWKDYDALICIMATGIVVRTIVPLVEDKKTDPAVLVMDQKGKYIIPILSGHLGGANGLARKISAIMGARPVVTTASDLMGNTALDIWIRDQGLRVANPEVLARLMGRLLDRGRLSIFSDSGLPPLPHDLLEVDSIYEADMIVTPSSKAMGTGEQHMGQVNRGALILHPPVLVAGIGCNRGTAPEKIADALNHTFISVGLSLDSLCRLASIDIKKDEIGLVDFANKTGLDLFFYSAQELNSITDTGYSEAVFRATGARGVCEPAAVLASGQGELIVRKQRCKDVTIAVAKATWPWWEQAPGQ